MLKLSKTQQEALLNAMWGPTGPFRGYTIGGFNGPAGHGLNDMALRYRKSLGSLLRVDLASDRSFLGLTALDPCRPGALCCSVLDLARCHEPREGLRSDKKSTEAT